MSAWRDGIRRVNRAPAILAGLWLLTLSTTMPLALTLREGQRLIFHPTVADVSLLPTLDAFADNTPSRLAIDAAASGYAALWLFLAGGIIDRYARERPTRAFGFFSACGGFIVRFIRLGIVMGIVYGFLFGWMRPWLFDRLYPRMIRDVTVQRTAFFAFLMLYAVFVVVLAGCNLIFDYAMVRAVAEDRRSMLGSIAAAIRFIGSHYTAAVSLYVADILLLVLAIAAYALLAPASTRGELPVWLGFAVGQACIVACLWAKLVFWASETALFQSRLAHAGYVAAPFPTWPDSPDAEAIGRITPTPTP